jgi:hypothetical protein
MEYQDDMFPEDLGELETMLATKTINLLKAQQELDSVAHGYREVIKESRDQIKKISERIDNLRKQQI